MPQVSDESNEQESSQGASQTNVTLDLKSCNDLMIKMKEKVKKGMPKQHV